MIDYQAIVNAHCREYDLSLTLSADMPAGYETAFGTYVPETRVLHLNAALLQGAPRPDALFYLYHELRHAEQYQHPERFSPLLRDSLPYVLLYNGQCFRQAEDGWRSCRLTGDKAWFTRVYLSLPYELDANDYACRHLERNGLDATHLRQFWLPADPLPDEDLRRLFRQIDEAAQ